jgi:solute carrier family 12 (sodium/potassium/chloride transporter), member 2
MKNNTPGYQFGTFKGVFTPSILTIMGVIMFLRFGWVLGNVGLFRTLLIVTIATGITFLTALSISALATNMKIKGGGAYYIISRSLGLETGAAVGIPLFFAQALGISFYIVGFSESVLAVAPHMPIKLIALITLAVLAILVYFSANIALRAQFFILTALVLALISFFLGNSGTPIEMAPNTIIPTAKSFWIVFAVFFPAVTGIEAGLAMSGDLKEPEKALPWGTLMAIGISYVIYMVIPIYLSIIIHDKAILITNLFIIKDIARWGWIIVLGVWGATLSSALGALLGAPRTLQALAKDKVIPRFIGRGFGQGNDPRIAVIITLIIAATGIMLGNLNAIAPILSMFFLISYGLLNISAAFEGIISSPSWRPTFKTPWVFSLIGGLACLGAMLMINSGATIIALIIAIIIFIVVKRQHLLSHWGNIKYGIWMVALHYFIYKLENNTADERTWRPNVLAFINSTKKDINMLRIMANIVSNRGFLTVITIINQPIKDKVRLKNLKISVRNYLENKSIKAMVNILYAKDDWAGIQNLINTYGFGPVKPNTIYFEFNSEKNHLSDLTKVIFQASQNDKNIMIFIDNNYNISEKENINVFWGGHKQNIGFMIAMAIMLQEEINGQDNHVMINSAVTEKEKKEIQMQYISTFIDEARIKATPNILLANKTPVFEKLKAESKKGKLNFLGLKAIEENESLESYQKYIENLIPNLTGFGPLILCLANETIDFYKIFEGME